MLARPSRLLLLDEPEQSLDPGFRQELAGLLLSDLLAQPFSKLTGSGGSAPVTPARRSRHAAIKAAVHASADGQILHSFRGLLGHLATLTRATITIGATSFEKTSDPTPVQRRAFELIGAPIPLTLTLK